MSTDTIPASIAIAAPQPDTLRRGAAAALDLVQNFAIVDDATQQIAVEELHGIKAKRDSLDEQRKAITRPLDGVKAAVMALFRGPVDLLDEAERILKGKLLGYQREQQAKLDAARMEAERIAQAERERIQAEAQALAEQGRSGEAAVKEAVAAMVVAAPAAAPVVTAPSGISTRETIDFEVENVGKLIAYIVTGNGDAQIAKPELLGLLVTDSVKLRSYVRGLGLQCNLPGVRVFGKQTLAASRKAA